MSDDVLLDLSIDEKVRALKSFRACLKNPFLTKKTRNELKQKINLLCQNIP